MSFHGQSRERQVSSTQFRNQIPIPRPVTQEAPVPPLTNYQDHQSSRFARHQRQTQSPLPSGNIKLITNAYNLEISRSNATVYEYKLHVEPAIGCKHLLPKLLSKAFVSRSIRKLLMEKIITQISKAPIQRGSILIEPNLETIFTLTRFQTRGASSRINTTSEAIEDDFKFINVNVASDLIANLSIDISINYSRPFKLIQRSHTASLLSSILHHQLLIDMPRYESVYYLSNDNPDYSVDRLDLISSHFMGISISGTRRTNDEQTLVVVNCSHSYITQSHRLIDLLASYIEGRPVHNIETHHDPKKVPPHIANRMETSLQITSMVGSEQWFVTFCSILLGFKCRSIDINRDKVNLRFHLTELPAYDLHIDGKCGATVYEYYLSKGIKLVYPNLPCLQSRSTKQCYFPFELCSLMPGQKVPIFRLSSKARMHLLSLNKSGPNVSRTNSVEAKNEIASRNRFQFESFGLKLSSSPAEAVGTKLSKPILQYRDQVIHLKRDSWESSYFPKSVDLIDNWCLVDTTGLEEGCIDQFFGSFSRFSKKFDLNMGPPARLNVAKKDIDEDRISMEAIVEECSRIVRKSLRFIIFIIDSNSTRINRLIHYTVDGIQGLAAACIRAVSVMNVQQQRSIFRTLAHKINYRLGGVNITYSNETFERLSLESSNLMVVGLDVTHPDNELSGVSIVGCAYTFSKDLFRHKSLVWPQAARKEIIARMDSLMERLLEEYRAENSNKLPDQIIIYRDGVSHEEFNRVYAVEISKAGKVIEDVARSNKLPKPNLSYLIAQKRHTMRFFRQVEERRVLNPPGGTLIDQGIVPMEGREFYLYSNTSPLATARPLHYHVLLNGLGMENIQKLTYYLCFNFGKCSTSLSMPSSLRYAHNAAYDARNRVINLKEFDENKFYTTKFFC